MQTKFHTVRQAEHTALIYKSLFTAVGYKHKYKQSENNDQVVDTWYWSINIIFYMITLCHTMLTYKNKSYLKLFLLFFFVYA